MIYPQKLNSKKSNLIVKLGISISLIIAIIISILNWLTTPQIPWAAIANCSIIYIWVILFYSIKKRINIAGHVLMHTISISLLNIYIDYRLGFTQWSLNIAIPIIIIIANITMLVLTIVSHKQFIKYAIYQLIIVFFSIIPIIFITENIIQNKTLSIIAIAISVLNFLLSIILCTKDVRETVIRKFHV